MCGDIRHPEIKCRGLNPGTNNWINGFKSSASDSRRSSYLEERRMLGREDSENYKKFKLFVARKITCLLASRLERMPFLRKLLLRSMRSSSSMLFLTASASIHFISFSGTGSYNYNQDLSGLSFQNHISLLCFPVLQVINACAAADQKTFLLFCIR